MDIYAKEGTKVKFLNKNGYDSQLEDARKYLKKGDILTVKRTIVHSCSTRVFFKEYPSIPFNSVMFKDI